MALVRLWFWVFEFLAAALVGELPFRWAGVIRDAFGATRALEPGSCAYVRPGLAAVWQVFFCPLTCLR